MVKHMFLIRELYSALLCNIAPACSHTEGLEGLMPVLKYWAGSTVHESQCDGETVGNLSLPAVEPLEC